MESANSYEDGVCKAVSLVEGCCEPMEVSLVNVKRTNKMNDCTDLVELAKQVQTADNFVRANASNKLSVIAEQMRFLQEQARQVLMEARRDADLHHVACNLVKKPGTTYHLYRRQSGQSYLSILSPQEWGTGCPHEFLGSYHLELDMSWTPVGEKDGCGRADSAVVDSILDAHLANACGPETKRPKITGH